MVLLAVAASADTTSAVSPQSWESGATTVTLSRDGTLRVSGKGPMADPEELINPTPWHRVESPITGLVIEEGVTYIGKRAFGWLNELKSVTIPKSVTAIGAEAFRGCGGLMSVTIPNGVTTIGSDAFAGCTSLISLTIPRSVKSIEWGAFRGCTGLKSVTITNGVTTIRAGAFSDCTGLTSITIPNSVTSIEAWAFSGCTNLKSVTIPGSVAEIERETFSYCIGLTSVTIKNGVKSIGDRAFLGCTGLTSITIPHSVTSIGEQAFASSGLKSITIPGSVVEIKSGAFSYCTGLTSVTIEEGVRSIGDWAFAGTGLSSLELPQSVTTIGDGAGQTEDQIIEKAIIAIKRGVLPDMEILNINRPVMIQWVNCACGGCVWIAPLDDKGEWGEDEEAYESITLQFTDSPYTPAYERYSMRGPKSQIVEKFMEQVNKKHSQKIPLINFIQKDLIVTLEFADGDKVVLDAYYEGIKEDFIFWTHQFNPANPKPVFDR
jgi:hypothetical protein